MAEHGKEYVVFNSQSGHLKYEGFDEKARTYKKSALTKAVRIEGPFLVETSEGPLTCEDGYLCMDSRGYYYPVDATEFANIYVEAETSE